MISPALQTSLDHVTWLDPDARRLPGVAPMDPDDWFRVDDAFAAQMARRDALIGSVPSDVHAQLPEAAEAADECLDLVLAACAERPDYDVSDGHVRRPDGVVVRISRQWPLLTIGKIIQEDMCLMQPNGSEHVLTGAILCFPASWTLAEKIGRPLVEIHTPVDAYDADIARRVQRLFDGIQVGRPLWRANALTYSSPELFHPRREADGHRPKRDNPTYLRSERQTITRLPRTGAVVFSIHTYIWSLATLPQELRASFAA